MSDAGQRLEGKAGRGKFALSIRARPDLSHTPHFIRAMQTGEFTLSDYYVGQRVGPTLLTALPHRGPRGSIDVVVTGPLALSWFTEVARSLAMSFDAVVMMVDSKGTLLTRQPSRESWVGPRTSSRPRARIWSGTVACPGTPSRNTSCGRCRPRSHLVRSPPS